jgi:hypothetical protein
LQSRFALESGVVATASTGSLSIIAARLVSVDPDRRSAAEVTSRSATGSRQQGRPENFT